jgi:TRAP-type C4-dicarboxylate transport system substrate-binding protein
MNRNRRRPWLSAAGITMVAALAGCSSASSVDRAGGDSVRLRLTTIDGEVNSSGQLYGPEAFVAQLAEVSGGRLTVDVTTDYGDGAADAESRLVSAIAAGDVDGGWPSTRAFAEAGIPGLEAVEAPMLLSSAAAVRDLVTSEAVAASLRAMDDSGVAALGLAAGPLRRPFAAEAPLLAPADWAHARFRAYNSPVQDATIHALGGTPVELGIDWMDEVRGGTLRGAEFDVAQYAANGFTDESPYVTANVVLWPKVFVLALSQERFDALTQEQQSWVREAAARAVEASAEGSFDDSAQAEELCAGGVRFIEADDAQLAELRKASAPVVAELAADPATSALLAEVQAIADRHPEPDVPDVPESCRTTDDAPSAGPAQGPDPGLPDGVYRAAISVDEVLASGNDNGPGWSGTWTLEISDGTYVLSCRPLDGSGQDCGGSDQDGPLEAGRLQGADGTVSFVFDAELLASASGCTLPASTTQEGHCYQLPPYTVDWVADGEDLLFSEPTGGPAQYLVIEPWQRIG